MRAPEKHQRSEQERTLIRFKEMGVSARLMQGGRCVLASMPLRVKAFETLDGQIEIPEVLFSTVGRDRIKCLQPRPLFSLPLIRVFDCRDAHAIESRIRRAWQTQLIELRSAQNWLRQLGIEPARDSSGTTLSFPIAGEEVPIRVQVRQPRRVILPGRGPLAKTPLRNAEDRYLTVDPAVRSAVDLEIAISTRLEELSRLDARWKDDVRRLSLRSSGRIKRARNVEDHPRKHRILLVGPRLSRERPCIDSLRLRNYEVLLAGSQSEALDLFDELSPELVLADLNLGRSEGIEIIPALREVVGIDDVPVVLVDTHARGARRLAAQKAGAAGYLCYPVEISRIAKRIEQMVAHPKRRRYTRFPQQVAIHLSGVSKPGTLTQLSRGGIFFRTDDDLEPSSIHSCSIALHEIGKTVHVETEVLYQLPSGGTSLGIAGRFHEFATQDEATLIEYLCSLRDDDMGGQPG